MGYQKNTVAGCKTEVGQPLGRNPLPLARATYQRSLVGRPVVQRGRIKIGSVWPYECAYLGVNTDLIEDLFIPQRSEQLPGEHRPEINYLFRPVLKLYTQGIGSDNLDGLNVMNRVVHAQLLTREVQ